MESRRGDRRLARELIDLRESHDALARARHLPFSDVEVERDGEVVAMPIEDLLQEGVDAGVAVGAVDERVQQIEVESIPFVQQTMEERQQAVADADAAAVAAAGLPVGSIVLVQATTPTAEWQNGTTLWIDRSIPSGSTAPANTPKRWLSGAWTAVTSAQAVTTAQLAVNARAGLAGALAAADAARAMAAAAEAHVTDIETVTLIPLRDQWAAFYQGSTGENTLGGLQGLITTADKRMTVATVNPTAADAAGRPLLATWEVRSGGAILRKYVLTAIGASPTWTQVKIGREFVGDEAIGRAQIALLAVADAQIENVHGGKVMVNSVDTTRLLVQPGNEFPDPWFRDVGGWPSTGFAKRIDDATLVGGGGLEITTNGSTQVGSYYRSSAHIVQFDPGAADYIVQATVKIENATTNRIGFVTGGTRSDTGGAFSTVSAYLTDADQADGTYTVTVPFTTSPLGTGPTRVGFFNYGARADGAKFTISNVAIRKRVGGVLITPEGVLAEHVGAVQIQARHIAADVGEALDLSSNVGVTILAGQVGDVEGAAAQLASRTTAAEGAAASLAQRVGTAEGALTGQAAAISDAQKATTKVAADLATQATYYNFTPAGLVIGVPTPAGEPVGSQVVISPQRIVMGDNGEESLWIQGGTVHATRFEGETVALGKHVFERDGTTGTLIRALGAA